MSNTLLVDVVFYSHIHSKIAQKEVQVDKIKYWFVKKECLWRFIRLELTGHKWNEQLKKLLEWIHVNVNVY